MQSNPRYLRLMAKARSSASPLEEATTWLNSNQDTGPVWLFCRDRILNLPELREIEAELAGAGTRLERVVAQDPLGLVAAAGLGLETALEQSGAAVTSPAPLSTALTIHRGTLRSGDHLDVEGSLLILGDVNPGARVSAGGDVRVWGRLRGVAHAGAGGNRQARIVALQLRPLQLRIADAVARGPEDLPPAGFCEQALLAEGAISIEPAEPQWPDERSSPLSG
jgi:septum site-determining protein MinC